MLERLGFHPETAAWFAEQIGTPTAAQAESWPLIAAGHHVLVTAPTGSGKTLTAFLWAMDRFATGELEPGATRILYVSPLKALNNDIQRNVLGPLAALAERLPVMGDLRVLTRSGDTSPGDRQRMLRRPPEILITTPESLNLLLTTPRGRQALSKVCTLILDEIHAVIDNRRGVALMTAAERLVHLAGEVQRIALSATVTPLDEVAAYVGGVDTTGANRTVRIVSTGSKEIELEVRFPEEARTARDAGRKIWEPLAGAFRQHIDRNTSTLLFTNSRRLAERITLTINDDAAEPVAYAHHGSLSREIRTEVEARMKNGALKAIVATNSLELGIDVGHLDEVVLVQSPPSVAATLQRIGRAGHRVGEVSRGSLYPTHARDFVEAAALADAVAERAIEPVRTLVNPLDVLAQIIVATTASETWHVDDLFALLTRAAPYRALDRPQFDRVVEMLAGRYAGSRIRDLAPRLVFDRIEGTIAATRGAVLALYSAGGTIPDRGYFKLRHAETGALIGELDEEFVWEAAVGQTFTLGTQHWQVRRITHNDVLVHPAPPTRAPPFWRAEGIDRGFHYSERIARFLGEAESALAAADRAGLTATLIARRGFEPFAAAELVELLDAQRRHTGAPLPHRGHLLIERVRTTPGGYAAAGRERQHILHTGWGGRVNRPFALALGEAWRQTFGTGVEVHSDNDAIVLLTKTDVDPARIVALVDSANLHTLLRAALESSGFFGARFRECAGRALLITRRRFNHRTPLWMSRLAAKKLMTTVKTFSDFPVLIETWRTCLNDEFDLPALGRLLDELADGRIAWSFVDSETPSPFAATVAWQEINRYMYADDTPETGASALAGDLIEAAARNALLRPRIDAAIVAEFTGKRQRTAPGYAPAADEVGEWLKERLLVTAAEWRALGDAVERDCGATIDGEATAIRLTSADGGVFYGHRESAHALVLRADAPLEAAPSPPVLDDARDTAAMLGDILTFHGPMTREEIEALVPFSETVLNESLAALVDDEQLIEGPLLTGEQHCYCDADNLATLLRFQRARARPALEPRPVTAWPGFVAAWQGFGAAPDDERLMVTLEKLNGYSAPVAVWLDELLHARHPGFAGHRWDTLLGASGMRWRGAGRGQLRLVFADDLDLLGPADAGTENGFAQRFADPRASYRFLELADAGGDSLERASEAMWQAVWAGRVTADSVEPLRQGLARRFTLGADTGPARRGSVRRRARQRATTWSGTWSLLPRCAEDDDPLEVLERQRERARVLLERYGMICRDLANREAGSTPGFRWRELFPALRLMELGGEVVAGQFFLEMSAPQFLVPGALAHLTRSTPERTFWMNATDPAAPTGMSLDWPGLPARRSSNHLVFRGPELVLISESNARRLTIHLDPDDATLPESLAVLTHLAARRKRLELETINGTAAISSPYLTALSTALNVSHDHRSVFCLPL